MLVALELTEVLLAEEDEEELLSVCALVEAEVVAAADADVDEVVAAVLEPAPLSPPAESLENDGGSAAAPLVPSRPGKMRLARSGAGARFLSMRLRTAWSRATGRSSESACAVLANARTRAREQKSVRETFLETNMVVYG